MKKRLFTLLATALAGATLFLSACSSGDSKIVFKNHWNYNTAAGIVEPLDETLEYDVSYTSYSSQINYEIDYNGKYTTHLVLLSDDTYQFTTELEMTVSYTLNGETETLKDSVITTVNFHKAGGTENLRPLSSSRSIVSHTPVYTNSAAKLADCYYLFQYNFNTTYTDGTGTCTSTRRMFLDDGDYMDLTETFTYAASHKKRTFLDNEQFPVAFRAMPAGTDTKVQMFNPYLGYSQSYAVSLSGDAKEKNYEYKLNGTDVKRKIKYLTATIAVDSTASGLTQQAEIAAVTENNANSNRSIMLSYTAPLANYMGALEYKLVSATYA